MLTAGEVVASLIVQLAAGLIGAAAETVRAMSGRGRDVDGGCTLGLCLESSGGPLSVAVAWLLAMVLHAPSSLLACGLQLDAGAGKSSEDAGRHRFICFFVSYYFEKSGINMLFVGLSRILWL